MAQQQQRPKGERPGKYFNFGVGWLTDSGILNCMVNWQKNARANNGQAYKLFLVPVDGAGDPVGEGQEVTNFRIKQTVRTDKTPETAPDYSVYSWE